MRNLPYSSSLAFFIWRKFYQAYLRLEARIYGFYAASKIYKCLSCLWCAVRTVFLYSFLGRLSAGDSPGYPEVFGQSFFLSNARQLLSAISLRVRIYFKCGWLGRYLLLLKGGFSSRPLQLSGLILTVAMCVNIPLSLIFRRGDGMLGWAARFWLLAVGLSACIYQGSWQQAKAGSLIVSFSKLLRIRAR